jgi:hypothetical protein
MALSLSASILSAILILGIQVAVMPPPPTRLPHVPGAKREILMTLSTPSGGVWLLGAFGGLVLTPGLSLEPLPWLPGVSLSYIEQIAWNGRTLAIVASQDPERVFLLSRDRMTVFQPEIPHYGYGYSLYGLHALPSGAFTIYVDQDETTIDSKVPDYRLEFDDAGTLREQKTLLLPPGLVHAGTPPPVVWLGDGAFLVEKNGDGEPRLVSFETGRAVSQYGRRHLAPTPLWRSECVSWTRIGAIPLLPHCDRPNDYVVTRDGQLVGFDDYDDPVIRIAIAVHLSSRDLTYEAGHRVYFRSPGSRDVAIAWGGLDKGVAYPVGGDWLVVDRDLQYGLALSPSLKRIDGAMAPLAMLAHITGHPSPAWLAVVILIGILALAIPVMLRIGASGYGTRRGDVETPGSLGIFVGTLRVRGGGVLAIRGRVTTAPGEATIVIGPRWISLEPGFRRLGSARSLPLADGDEVWVEGRLVAPSGDGPYREGASLRLAPERRRGWLGEGGWRESKDLVRLRMERGVLASMALAMALLALLYARFGFEPFRW